MLVEETLFHTKRYVDIDNVWKQLRFLTAIDSPHFNLLCNRLFFFSYGGLDLVGKL